MGGKTVVEVWRNIGPYRSLSLDPAAAVLHYGQEIFEGLKAYRRADGGIIQHGQREDPFDWVVSL